MVFALWDVTRYRDDFSTVGLFTAGFHRLSLVDENGPEVVDVGQGRAGYDLIAERLEESVPIVVGDAPWRWCSASARASVSGPMIAPAISSAPSTPIGIAAMAWTRSRYSIGPPATGRFDVAAAAAVSPDGDRGLRRRSARKELARADHDRRPGGRFRS